MRNHFQSLRSARAAQHDRPGPQAILQTAALAAGIAAGIAAIPATAFAQLPVIVVTDGTAATVPDTYASGTYDSITVSGMGTGGERSTLTVNEPVVLDSYSALIVTTGGLLEINANVTTTEPYYSSEFREGGTLSLVSGTLSTGYLTLSGSGAFQRTGGSYAVNTGLRLSDGATGSFDPGDAIGGQDGGFVDVSSGATFVLNASLGTDTATVAVDVSGAGSSLVRSTGAETINGFVSVANGANLALIADDEISGALVGDIYGSGTVAPSTLTLAPGMTSLVVQYLGLGSGGSIVGLESIPYSTTQLYVTDQRVEYRAGAITDSISEFVSIAGSGTLALQQNLTLTGTYAQLNVRNAGSTLERNGHSVTTPALLLNAGASLTVGDGISVSREVGLYDGTAGVPTVLSLASNLVLAGSDGQPARIALSGTDTRIVRASGVTITATAAEMTVSSGSFAMQAGDDFTGSTLVVSDGATVSNAAPQSLLVVNVTGSNDVYGTSTYTANAPLVISGTVDYGSNLTVQFGGRFEAAADVTAGTAEVAWEGVLALLSGTFTATDTLFVTGSGAVVTVDRGAGAAYDVALLALSNGAAMDFDAATDSVGILSLSSGATFTTGTSGGGLDLTDLSIVASGTGEAPPQLRLGSFGGTGGPGEWGLQTPDTLFSSLQGWITDGSIVSLSGAPLTVTQQDGFAYVTSVPEPTSLALLAGGIAAASVTVRRRSRRRRPTGV